MKKNLIKKSLIVLTSATIASATFASAGESLTRQALSLVGEAAITAKTYIRVQAKNPFSSISDTSMVDIIDENLTYFKGITEQVNVLSSETPTVENAQKIGAILDTAIIHMEAQLTSADPALMKTFKPIIDSTKEEVEALRVSIGDKSITEENAAEKLQPAYDKVNSFSTLLSTEMTQGLE